MWRAQLGIMRFKSFKNQIKGKKFLPSLALGKVNRIRKEIVQQERYRE